MTPIPTARFILLLALVIPLHAIAQLRVTALQDTLVPESTEFMVYSLPRTKLVVDLTLLRTAYQRGPFHEYAKEYLDIDNAIVSDGTDYRLLAAGMNLVQEPDPAHYYQIATGKSFSFRKKKPLALSLTREGFLCALNVVKQECPSPNCDTHARNFGFESRFHKDPSQRDFSHQINPDLLRKPVKELPTMDSGIGPMPMRPVFKIETRESSVKDRAKEAIESLAKLRENRQNLASGYQEVSYMDGTIRLMVEQLQQMEDGIIHLFKGLSQEEAIQFQASYLPVDGRDTTVILAYLSKTRGILDRAESEASPVVLQITYGSNFPDWKLAEAKAKKQPLGLVYRIPVMAQIKVMVDDVVLYGGYHAINQAGRVARLPANADRVEFYPETGGVKCIW